MPSPFDKKPHYHGETKDRCGNGAICRSPRLTEKLSALVGKLQHGRIHVYLLYSFVTLLALLVFIR